MTYNQNGVKMTNDEILNNAHLIRENLMKKIMPYINNKINFKTINKIYMDEILKYTNDANRYLLDNVKNFKFKKPNKRHTRYILINFYIIFANVTNAYISSLDEDTNIFFSGFELYDERNYSKIAKAIRDFKARKLLDDEMLDFLNADNPDDLKLIIKNNMIDIYLIQMLTNVKNYAHFLIVLNQVKLLGSYRDDYVYSYIIRISNLLK